MSTGKLNAFWQLIIIGTATFVVVVIVLVTFVGPAITDFVLEQQKLSAVVFANRLAAEFLAAKDFKTPITDESRENFEEFVGHLQIPGLFRIKIWNSDGVIVYSDVKELVGKRFPLDDLLGRAFNLETVVSIRKFDPQNPRFQHELQFGEGLEIHAPITFGNSKETVGVITTYARVGFLKKEIGDIRTAFLIRIALAMLLTFAAPSFLVWRASRTVATQQARLQVYAKGLERMVDEKTRELKETSEKQVKQAEDLARLEDEFVALASHQLRTPPSIIKWYSQILLSGEIGELNDKQRQYVEEVYRATKRMVRLVNDFLNISRIESGSISVKPEPTNLSKIADSAIVELTTLISAKRTQIEKHYDKDVPVIYADQKFVRIIFENLISNAIKYTPPGGKVSVTIQKEKSNVLIKVRDNGYGIPENQKSKMFTKFFRADNVKSKEPEGTGLGLYLVKFVIEQAGGTIRFESKEGLGTTFYITIPISGMKKKEGRVTLA